MRKRISLEQIQLARALYLDEEAGGDSEDDECGSEDEEATASDLDFIDDSETM